MAGDGQRVRVRLVPWFGDLAVPGQGRTVTLDRALAADASLRDLLADLAGQLAGFATAVYDPEAGRLQPGVVVTHNGRVVPMTELDRALADGDEITLVPPYSGG